jgi:O-6-methylguanine DNA methyltransferase
MPRSVRSRGAATLGKARFDSRSVPNDFTRRVLAVVKGIPPGRVATYGDVAELAGRPRAARAVGNIMRTCGRADIPCHRVIASGGRLGGYGGREAFKRALLSAEGVPMRGPRVAIDDCRWDGGSGKSGTSVRQAGVGTVGRTAQTGRAGKSKPRF